jgi:hypothetical protein
MEKEVRERFERIEQTLERHSQEMDKHKDAIRDLIVVGRTCLDSIRAMGERHDRSFDRTDAEIDKLRVAQKETEEKLNILVDTVDKIIRHRNGPNPQ